MKKSLSRVMSIILTVAMMLTLLPATFVSAANAPVFTLSVVDAAGNELTALHPGTSAYLRVGVSGIEAINDMAVKVEATNAQLDATAANLVKKYTDYSDLSAVLEINLVNGVTLSTSSSSIKFTQIMGQTVPDTGVAITEFSLVDIPFTVPANTEIGTDVAFTFATGSNETNISIGGLSATNRYTIGHSTRPITANEVTIAVTEDPYTITDFTLVPTFEVLPLGADFPGFDGKVVRATMDKDNDEVPGFDTQDYEIVTDAPTEGKAYIDTTSFNKDAMGTYTFDVVIKDSTKKNAGGLFTKEDAVTVVVGDAVKTGAVTADTTKVVEVKYGSELADIKAAIAARSDLFKDVYTNGDEVPATYTITEAAVDAASVTGTTVGDYTATVTAIDGVSIENGEVKVKVVPTTITAIALETPWVAYPEAPEGTEFPGFAGNRVVATFDSATSAIENATFDIATDTAASEKAFIDPTDYDAATAGTYNLPVIIITAAVAELYEGTIALTVDPAAATDRVELVAPYLMTTYTEDEAAAKAAAEALVLAQEDMFYTILTNDERGAVAEGVLASTVTSEYVALENKVAVTITSVTDGKTLEGDAVVNVSLGEPPATKAGSAEFVDDEGNPAAPSIKAAISDYEEDPSKLALDWSAYDLTIEYANPNPAEAEETPYLTATYEYSEDGANGTYTVEGWLDFEDGGEVGTQTVTVKVYDSGKAKVEGEEYVYVGTLTATMEPADTTGKVRVVEDKEVKVSYATTLEKAITTVTKKSGLFEEIFKDGSAKKADVKATVLTIAEYDSTLPGDYVATITAIDDETKTLDGEAALTVVVKTRNIGGGGGVTAGTVVKDNNPEIEKEPILPPETEQPGTDTEETPVTTPEEETKEEETPQEVYIADVKNGHWAKDAIVNLIRKGIVTSDSNFKVRPDDGFTREEASKTIVLAAKYPVDGTTVEYADAASISDWAVPYVTSATANGVFTGYPDGTFAPQGTVTREQLAAIIIRAFNFGEGTKEITFADSASITWSKAYVAKAVELGIVNGYAADNTFRPANVVTRAEAFAMISRALTLKEAIDAAMNTTIIEKEQEAVDAEIDETTSGDDGSSGADTDVSEETETEANTPETTGSIDVNGDGVVNSEDDVNNDGEINQEDVDEFNEEA